MSLNLDKTDLINNMLIIRNDDGSVKCIPEEGCTVEEKAMFEEFRQAYPNGKAEVEVPIDSIKAKKNEEIEQACKFAIISGFKSSAYQGIEKTYASALEDQANITENALLAALKIAGVPDCQNSKFYYHSIGEDFAEWTAEECLQLARDFKAFKEIQLLKSKALQNYVFILKTVEQINLVSWETEIHQEDPVDQG